jgi:hypothetical protein
VACLQKLPLTSNGLVTLSVTRTVACRPPAVRQKGNLLLCTLLLGGTILNSAISIILSSVTSGVVGLLLSSFVILILGNSSQSDTSVFASVRTDDMLHACFGNRASFAKRTTSY